MYDAIERVLSKHGARGVFTSPSGRLFYSFFLYYAMAPRESLEAFITILWHDFYLDEELLNANYERDNPLVAQLRKSLCKLFKKQEMLEKDIEFGGGKYSVRSGLKHAFLQHPEAEMTEFLHIILSRMDQLYYGNAQTDANDALICLRDEIINKLIYVERHQRERNIVRSRGRAFPDISRVFAAYKMDPEKGPMITFPKMRVLDTEEGHAILKLYVGSREIFQKRLPVLGTELKRVLKPIEIPLEDYRGKISDNFSLRVEILIDNKVCYDSKTSLYRKALLFKSGFERQGTVLVPDKYDVYVPFVYKTSIRTMFPRQCGNEMLGCVPLDFGEGDFLEVIRTANRLSDREMDESFVRELHRTVSKGPILDIKDTFEPSKSIGELIREGVLTEEFCELEALKSNQGIYKRKLPLTRPLYTHQERAVRHITSGNNAVVTTGTGSGKTECFLIPVLNELLEQKHQGILPASGVQAILIYPMNALANDQIKRLRELLIFYPDITFGVYNGDTEHEYSKAESKYMSLHSLENCKELRTPLSNELISREQMHEMPPHILCTNYAMLEHLLLKPEADKLFSGADMRFVILDEAHVYHGVTGMETALLLRRLKARARSTKDVRFVLTSATLGTQGENDDQIVHFAKTLTGVEYKKEDIIFGKRIVQQFSDSQDVPMSFFRDASSLGDLKGLDEVFAWYSLPYDEKR